MLGQHEVLRHHYSASQKHQVDIQSDDMTACDEQCDEVSGIDYPKSTHLWLVNLSMNSFRNDFVENV